MFWMIDGCRRGIVSSLCPLLRGLAVALLFLLLLGACSRNHRPVQGKTSSASTKTAEARNGGAKGPGPLMVAIIPKAPTVRDDLHLALPSGSITRCRWRVNGEEIKSTEWGSLPKGKFRKGDTVSVTVTAGGRVGTASVTIADSPPKILAVRYRPAGFYRGVDLTAQPRAEDADCDPVQFRYRWLINGEKDPWADGAVLKGDQFHRGDRIILEVTPSDGEKDGKPFRSAAIVVPDAPPHFVSKPPAVKNWTYVYNARAEDPDGDTLSYTLLSGPGGMTIDAHTGRLTWKIGSDQIGKQRAKIAVRDGRGRQALQEMSFNISLSR